MILILLGVGVYFFNLQNPLFWDDDDWIINNVYVHDITWDNVKFWFTHNTLAGVGLKSNYYRPFLFFTFALNYIIAGVKPVIWHLTSNLIHVANGLLVFLLLSKLMSPRRPNSKQWASLQSNDAHCKFSLAAFLTALLFLIHPLQTEAVTYISGRGDLLVAFFMLLALLLSVLRNSSMFGSSTSKHREVLRGSASKYPEVEPLKSQIGQIRTSQVRILRLGMSRYYWPLSIGLLVLALLSRETAIIFPFLAVLVLMTLSQDRFVASLKKSLKAATPFFGVVGVYGILRLTVLNFQNTLNFYPVANVYSESLMARLYTFGGVLIDYVRLLFVPLGLHMERSVTVYTSLFQWPVYLVFLILIGFVIFLLYLYHKEISSRSKIPNSPDFVSRQSRDYKIEDSRFFSSDKVGAKNRDKLPTTHFSAWFFGVAWFFIGLVPVSGITPINAVMYEHWLYLPMIGFWFIVVFYLAKLFQGSTFFKTCPVARRRRWFGIQGRTLISPTSQVKILRLAMSKIVIVGLVVYFSFFGYQSIQRNILWGKPVEFYQNILKYEPQSARINNNLGNLYYNDGDTEKAKLFYQKSAESDDTFPQPHFNLGSILESEGDIFGAIKEYEKAIEIDPDFYYPYQNLVAIYANRGELVKAAEYVETLKRLKSYDPRVFYNSALISLALGETQEAINDLEQGLKVVGSDAEAGALINELLSKISKK